MDIFLCVLILLLLFTDTASPLSHPDRFTRSLPHSHRHREYFEVTYPLLSHEPGPSSCSREVLRHSFANTINSPPFSTPYSPPSGCPAPWTRVILHFYAECKGEQYDRIAGIWLGGAELFRTSTAEPTKSGIFWNVRKDITRYSSLLLRSDLDLTMMLENIVNHEYTGVYHVTVTLLYFKDYAFRVPFRSCSEGLNRGTRFLGDETETAGEIEISEVTGKGEEDAREAKMRQGYWDLNESPADLIIPISDDGGRGFWFKVEGELDSHSRRIQIPRNTHRAVLELYVSFHGNDEFWYSNPPNSYIKTNGLTTRRGNGAYREVYVTIDGEVVGSEVPFPVIFTGGINPLSWEPMVAIGAFDLPSYDMELTPFLGKLLDGKEHSFQIGVDQGISYWLVNANLHLWLDSQSSVVHANRVTNQIPESTIERQEEFTGLDGSFEIEAEREMEVAGWVSSSAGNITTIVSQGFALKNFIKFQKNGTYKVVRQRFRAKKKMKVINDKGELIAVLKVKRKYPLRVMTSTRPRSQKNRYLLVTNVSHAVKEKRKGRCFSSSTTNSQDSRGWMEVKDHSVLKGQASTLQNYSYVDRFDCYSRKVAAVDGRLIRDNSTFECL